MSEKIIDTPEKDISNGAGLNHSLAWIIPIIAAAYFVFKAVRKIRNS